MREFEDLYGVSPDKIWLDRVPVLYTPSLKSSEPLDSDNNRSSVRYSLETSTLKDKEKEYIFAIYLELGNVVKDVGTARKVLTSDNPENKFPALFKNEANRTIDIKILRKMLTPNKWGKDVALLTFVI